MFYIGTEQRYLRPRFLLNIEPDTQNDFVLFFK